MGFTYYFLKSVKIGLILISLTWASALMLYLLLSGVLEDQLLGFQMSTESALCVGATFLVSFMWSLSLIRDEIKDMLSTSREWSKLDDLLSNEEWKKVDEYINKQN